MANTSSDSDICLPLSKINLGSSGNDTERTASFWHRLSVERKFSVEKVWLDAVWHCKNKPNYGMRDLELDPIFEERASNKLELTGTYRWLPRKKLEEA